MFKLNLLTKFFLLFTVSFVVLIILSNNEQIRKSHCIFYSTVASPIFNVLNPHVYAEFSQGAIENKNDWDITFKIWDKRQYSREIFVKSFRAKNPPKGILYQNHHEIILVPLLFILALMISSPLKLKPKLIRTFISLLVFYIFMTFYLSYRFEFTLNNQSLPLDSIWHVVITFLGLGGNTDPIYIFIFLLWVILVIPYLIKREDLLGKLFKNPD